MDIVIQTVDESNLPFIMYKENPNMFFRGFKINDDETNWENLLVDGIFEEVNNGFFMRKLKVYRRYNDLYLINYKSTNTSKHKDKPCVTSNEFQEKLIEKLISRGVFIDYIDYCNIQDQR